MDSPTHEGQGPELDAVLARARGGDEEAWRTLVRMYWRRVFALARSRCGRDDAAEEVTQSVFVTVAAKLGTEGYAERGRFEAWLFRVAMNRVRDEIRRAKRWAANSGALPDEEAPAAPVLEREAGSFDALRDALSRLADADREVIELRHHAGLSFRQMADLLNEPVGTLLARHHRALRKLRDLLDPPAEKTIRGSNEHD